MYKINKEQQDILLRFMDAIDNVPNQEKFSIMDTVNNIHILHKGIPEDLTVDQLDLDELQAKGFIRTDDNNLIVTQEGKEYAKWLNQPKYIILTHFDNHWDNLNRNETSYPIWMLQSGLQEGDIIGTERTQAILIKKESRDSAIIEKAWLGYVSDFSNKVDGTRKHITFKVEIESELSLSDVNKYKTVTNDFHSGWFCISKNDASPISHQTQTNTSQIFVDNDRLDELKSIKSNDFDLCKLIILI